jgi:hypothetical protein
MSLKIFLGHYIGPKGQPVGSYVNNTRPNYVSPSSSNHQPVVPARSVLPVNIQGAVVGYATAIKDDEGKPVLLSPNSVFKQHSGDYGVTVGSKKFKVSTLYSDGTEPYSLIETDPPIPPGIVPLISDDQKPKVDGHVMIVTPNTNRRGGKVNLTPATIRQVPTSGDGGSTSAGLIELKLPRKTTEILPGAPVVTQCNGKAVGMTQLSDKNSKLIRVTFFAPLLTP